MDPPSPPPPALSPLLTPSPSAGYIPLRDLLALGPSLWDDDEEEEFKPLDELDDSGGGHEGQVVPGAMREQNLEDRVKRRRRGEAADPLEDDDDDEPEGNKSDAHGTGGDTDTAATSDNAFYQSFLRAFASGEIALADDDESDSYDFLDDLDTNAGAIQMVHRALRVDCCVLCGSLIVKRC